MDHSEESNEGLRDEENDLRRLVLLLVEHLAVDAQENADGGEHLNAQVYVVADRIALEDVVDQSVGRPEYHQTDAWQVDVVS